MSTTPTQTLLLTICLVAIVSPVCGAEEEENGNSSFLSELPVEVHGFYEMRGGYCLRDDKYEKDMSIMENRFQVDLYSYLDWASCGPRVT